MHLLLVRSGVLRVTFEAGSAISAGLVTPPDFAHAIDAEGNTTVMIFIDAECEIGSNLSAALGEEPRCFDADTRDGLLAGLPPAPTGSELSAWMLRALGALDANARIARKLHPKVRRLLKVLESAPLSPAPRLADFAQQLGLSPARLMHVFAESTGTTWRAYLRWLRFQRAAGAIVRGASLTQAAHSGGFHDSAHMTKTFKAMYGLVPSQLQRA
jgi:AraC-like DNA-binding protein